MIATIIAEVVLLPLKAIGLTFVFLYLFYCMGVRICKDVERWIK